LGSKSKFAVGEELALLQAYVAQAINAWSFNPGDAKALNELRKVAAIAVRCMEHHDAPAR